MALPEPAPTAETFALLMRDLRSGSATAKKELVKILYPELRRVAAAKMKRERANHTLQPTAIVNELYLELLKIGGLPDREYTDHRERAAFMGLAGKMMDRLLSHRSRRLPSRVKRIEWDDADDPFDSGGEALQRVEDVLVKLEAMREDMGSVNPVIAPQMAGLVEGTRRELDTREAEARAAKAKRYVRVEREIKERIEKLHERLLETQKDFHLTPERIYAAVKTGLVVLLGEITTRAHLDYPALVRRTVARQY